MKGKLGANLMFGYGKIWVNKEFWWNSLFFPNLIKQIDPLKPNGGERVQMSILTELLNDVV